MMKRNGISFLELVAAGAVLVVMLATSLQLLGVIASNRRAICRRQTAVLAAANLMERVSARPLDRLDTESLSRMRLSEDVARELPEAELEMAVDETSDEPKGKRISISLRWKDNKGQFVAPVKLVAWRYR